MKTTAGTLKKVTDLRVLKAMQNRNLITLHEQTGSKVYWYGHYSKCAYIDDFKFRNFSYKNKDYECKYIDGCFYPYVFEVVN